MQGQPEAALVTKNFESDIRMYKKFRILCIIVHNLFSQL